MLTCFRFQAIKIAERAVQYADNNAIRSEAHLTIARILQLQGKEKATLEFTASSKANPNQTAAFLAIAQAHTAKSKYFDLNFIFSFRVFFLLN